MTLIVTVNGRESIWLLADRRLSFKARAPRDNARKVMILECTDGVAILGYAGLGATALGTEPADWMSAVLRGRKLPLEQSLGVLAEAMKKQFPKHMIQLPGNGGPAHNVVVTAFIGGETRIYSIDMAFTPDRKGYQFRYTRHVTDKSTQTKTRAPRIGLAGSGAMYLNRNKKWIRALLRMVRAHELGRVSARAVADHLANLNNEVHLGIIDKSVGPSCIVAWRYSKSGGGHQFYTGKVRDPSSASLPTIANGLDVSALAAAIMPHMVMRLEVMENGVHTNELDIDEINKDLASLPDTPDEKLR